MLLRQKKIDRGHENENKKDRHIMCSYEERFYWKKGLAYLDSQRLKRQKESYKGVALSWGVFSFI